MSNDETPDVPASRDRREAVREKAQQVQAKQSRSRLAKRAFIGVAGIAAVTGIGFAIAGALTSAASQTELTPANMQGDGVVVTSVAGAAVADVAADLTAPTPTPTPTPSASEAGVAATPDATPAPPLDIHVYVDYLSEGAAEFQQANAKQLSQWVTEDAATLTYHPVALLTSKSNGTKYSLRAANASACVATHSPDSFFAFNHELLMKQPEQNADGFTDPQLADIAIAASASNPKVVRACIEDGDFTSWVKSATERALSEAAPGTKDTSLTGTALVLVDGQPYVGALDDAKEFAQFVLTLSSEAYYSTATPTPTPTPTQTPAAETTPAATPSAAPTP